MLARLSMERTVREEGDEHRLYSWPVFIRRAPMTDLERAWLLTHVPTLRLTSDTGKPSIGEPGEPAATTSRGA